MLYNAWPESFKSATGGKYPNTYLCLDTEFTDQSENGMMLEFGFVLVKQGEPTLKTSFVLNWYSVPGIDRHALDYKLGRLAEHVPGWKFTPRFIQRNGQDVDTTLRKVAALLDKWQGRGGLFVAQNGIRADEKVIHHALQARVGRPFSFPENAYMDTGGLYMAEQIWTSTDPEINRYRPAVIPHKSETMKSYFARLTNLRIRNLSWKLQVIIDRYGIDLGKGETSWHTAAFDALCLHHIVKHVGSRISN